ncbi:MAG: glycosyltransferase [Alphaproteobacteria bacterium]
MNENKKSVLFILPALSAGGAERVLITYMNHIDRARFVPQFLSITNHGRLGSLISTDIKTDSLGCPRVSTSIFKLYTYIKTNEPDIVFTTMAYMNFILLLLRPFFKQTKFVVREANMPLATLKQHKRLEFFFRILYRILYPWADKVIVPAQCITTELHTALKVKTNNNVTIYNPVDDRIITQNTENTEHRPNVDFYFVASGRLHPQKGFDRLIEMFAQTNLPYTWHLDIIGDGMERDKLESLIVQHNLSARISLLGFLDIPWPLYQLADVLLLPSRYEGLPNVVLESLHCGTPVIAHKDAGGIQEIADLSASGSVQIVADMDAFAQSLAALKPARRQRHVLSQAFTLTHAISNLEDTFNAVLG